MTENEEEGHKVWYFYIPKCVENMTWEDEPIEIEISLKSHSTWKPSDEQMNAFDAVLVYNPPCSDECRNHLITLYNELKKLREE